jgi:nicotinamide phosphoribosyltransferase
MGGKLLQADINRDTLNFAIKCSFAIVNGQEVEVIKNPTEMDADGNIGRSFKVSKKGRLKLVKTQDGFKTVSQSEEGEDQLLDIFEDGKILKEFTFEDIREMVK